MRRRWWLRGGVTLACLAGLARGSSGQPAPQSDAVALLPLDADRSLEIYGQPVARAIARALEDGKVQVVVVGPRMAVPERARLIIDGTIRHGKAGAVAIALRIRTTIDGRVLESMSATASGLARLDVTTADLSARLLPIVHDQLAALHAPVEDHGSVTQLHPATDAREPASSAPERRVAIALVDSTRKSSGAALLGALDTAAADWTRAHHRQPAKLDAAKLDPRVAARAVVAGGAELAIGFWILGYTTDGAAPPMARARVRIEVADATAVLFDRVVVTDTVVGDRTSSPQELAARVAREVLAILRPHLRRQVPSWR